MLKNWCDSSYSYIAVLPALRMKLVLQHEIHTYNQVSYTASMTVSFYKMFVGMTWTHVLAYKSANARYEPK